MSEWVIDVRLWEAEHKDETKPRFGPRLFRRGFFGQPRQIIKTLLGRRDLANFTVDNLIETLSNIGCGDALEEKGQEALDNYFDVGRGKAEAIQDHINRGELVSVSLENSTKIALDEKMCGYWLLRTFALSEQKIARIQIVTEGSTGLSAVKRAIQQATVLRRREVVRDDRHEQEDRARDKTGSANDNVHTLSDGEESASETHLESLDGQDLWYATDDKADCVRPARNCSVRTTSRRFYKEGDKLT